VLNCSVCSLVHCSRRGEGTSIALNFFSLAFDSLLGVTVLSLSVLACRFCTICGNNELGEFTTKQTDLSFLTNQNNKTNIIIPLTYQNGQVCLNQVPK
jgi:hypothetical protein